MKTKTKRQPENSSLPPSHVTPIFGKKGQTREWVVELCKQLQKDKTVESKKHCEGKVFSKLNKDDLEKLYNILRKENVSATVPTTTTSLQTTFP